MVSWLRNTLICAISFIIITLISAATFGMSDNSVQKLFLAGRALGTTYYYLFDLSNKAQTLPYSDIKNEYSNAFQSLNILDIIVEDLEVNSSTKEQLKDLRFCLYEALNKQDINEAKMSATLNGFSMYFDNLMKSVKEKYSDNGDWLLNLGFYTSFQIESVNSKDKAKLLLSGFDNIVQSKPDTLPERINKAMESMIKLDKSELTITELVQLKSNAVYLTEYFTNYPKEKPSFSEIQELAGEWHGLLINPDCEKHEIRLAVRNDLSAIMDIDGIAKNIAISDIRLIDNYFTFMFKPIGTEKLYIKFNAKLSDNIFAGEIIDVIGEKGYWVLAKTSDKALSNDKTDTMFSYIKEKEEQFKKQSENKDDKPEPKPASIIEQNIIPAENIQKSLENPALQPVNDIKMRDKIEPGLKDKVLE